MNKILIKINERIQTLFINYLFCKRAVNLYNVAATIFNQRFFCVFDAQFSKNKHVYFFVEDSLDRSNVQRFIVIRESRIEEKLKCRKNYRSVNRNWRFR